MVLAPIYCDICEHRIGPSEPISEINGKIVGLCHTKPIIKTPKILCQWVGEYDSLDFGDLMEYWKFQSVPCPPGRNSYHSWWYKEIDNEIHITCMYISNFSFKYSATQLMTKMQATSDEFWPWTIHLDSLENLKKYLKDTI